MSCIFKKSCLEVEWSYSQYCRLYTQILFLKWGKLAYSHHSVLWKFIVGVHTQEQIHGCLLINWNIAKYFNKMKNSKPCCHLNI